MILSKQEEQELYEKQKKCEHEYMPHTWHNGNDGSAVRNYPIDVVLQKIVCKKCLKVVYL